MACGIHFDELDDGWRDIQLNTLIYFVQCASCYNIHIYTHNNNPNEFTRNKRECFEYYCWLGLSSLSTYCLEIHIVYKTCNGFLAGGWALSRFVFVSLLSPQFRFKFFLFTHREYLCVRKASMFATSYQIALIFTEGKWTQCSVYTCKHSICSTYVLAHVLWESG